MACQEALTHQKYRVATRALLQLHDHMKKETVEDITEALVLRLLIKSILESRLSDNNSTGQH